MRNRILLILFTCICSSNGVFAQISHGGAPLFLENHTLRNSSCSIYVEMPAFDLDSVLRLDEINKGNMRGSYPFAYKFYTNIKKGKDGKEFSLADGTKIWQVGIRSEGAYSINLLFTRFHLPRGGQLFIYNADHSHVIGAFDYRNNSSDGILPVRPVAGDAIIVEYSEPAGAEFEAQLEIGEVNHDYRDILRREPGTDIADSFLCMPDVLCENADKTLIRSTVLLTIDGGYACTGTLINNADNDGKPYLLTAVHCLNSELESGISKNMDHYVTKSGTVIAFFNYDRPVCGTTMKASEEMSIAIAHPKVILEKKDIALLEFQEIPPIYYNAYYAGWNIHPEGNQSPYINLHHPSGSLKKYGRFENNLALSSPYTMFDPNSHWRVQGWGIGSTYAGSSGSPLFNNTNQIVGSLSGGKSYCDNQNPNGESDYFAAFFKGWENNEDPNNQLKTYLDPQNTGITQLEGFDPHRENPLFRIANVDYNQGYELVATEYQSPNSGFLFGNSNLNVLEFAEEFNLERMSSLFGVYLFIPKMLFAHTSGVEIKIYSGENFPEKLITTQTFHPQYLNYTSNNGFGNVNKNTNLVPTECFVAFDDSVRVDRRFYVAYKINYSNENKFAVYNSSGTPPNTAWIKEENGQWTPAGEYAAHPVSTSLAIQPLLRYTNQSSIPDIEKTIRPRIHYIRNENRLILPNESLPEGDLYLYSVSGRLIRKIPVGKGQDSVILTSQPVGTVGIVRVLRGNEVYLGKFIY
jgi:hypothetical protein